MGQISDNSITAYYDSSLIGLIEITETDECISSLHLVEKQRTKNETSPLLKETLQQLDEYFAGRRKTFNLPLKQKGTLFQQEAWKYLLTIPYGTTVTYKEEAIGINNPNAVRAVGSANGKNNIAIIVPCHRVVASGGGLGGYAYGLDIKQKLLKFETQNL